jgi:polyribonucleotide nucleotidyltransferase
VQEHNVSVEIADGKTIHISTGKYAKQAGGAVVISSGDSKVLVTATVGTSDRPFNFLPLTMMYQDRNGSFGTIPGSYFKREGRSNERETLVSRLMDRPIRPMFPKHFRMELQVIATVMSFDKDSETDVLALCGASAALAISDAPFTGTIGGVRIVRSGGEFIINPNFAEAEACDMDLVFAGTADAITMIEGQGAEIQEDHVLDATDIAQVAIRKICEAIDELKGLAGKAKIELAPAPVLDEKLYKKVEKAAGKKHAKALAIRGKHERMAALKVVRNEIIAKLTAKLEGDAADAMTSDIKTAWSKMDKAVMRRTVIDTGVRLDGRATDEIRDIWCEVGISARAHGSAIFTRGETQAYVNIALGTGNDSQRMEEPAGKHERNFMLTYNFPPFCTGEAYPMRGPKRREIGHGALARRGMLAVLPSQDDFPYVLRSTAEVLESNGSSSMATVCGTTLALMDAGVPLKTPVAGIAMGLVKEGEDFAVLSDILGDEDHLGDMDFKVTGTKNGITAFQLDTKIAGISRAIMTKAMSQAREGRLHILKEMDKTLSAPREEMSEHAPRITTVHIKSDKIRDIIGPGGKVIRGIQEQCGVKITVDDSGRVDVASSDREGTDKAIAMIREITQEAEIGALYVGVVKRIVDFGAFVEIFPGTDGLVHISHLAHERIDKVTDVVAEGDEVLVRVIDVDRSGKIRLSRKEALEAV